MKVVITGGSGGIGMMIADALADMHELVLVARSRPDLEAAAGDLRKKHPKAKIELISADVTDDEAISRAFSAIDLSDIKCVINCAGRMSPVGRFHEIDFKEWKKTIDINLIGTATVCRTLLPHLEHAKSGRGKIINLSGGGSAYPFYYHTAYGSSKAAVVRFTETLALEYPDIDVNIIAPGAHKTKIWEQETWKEEPKEWSEPKRLGALVRFLVSEKADGITGKFIHINDEWESFTKDISKSEMYTLRRIEERKK